MDLQSLKNIPTSFAIAKRALFFCGIITLTVSLGSLLWAYFATLNIKNTAYVLTKDGQAALINIIPENEIDTYRLPEIKHHIKMFHLDFWEIDQFSYERKIDKALYLSGDSGKKLYKTLLANGHFAKISTENLAQKIEIDSISVNDKIYPYQASIYAKLKVLRTDQKTESINSFYAHFVLYNVSRTNENPHGLLIENYQLELTPIIKKE
jgi:type IV secretory pathway TrbF-like protein